MTTHRHIDAAGLQELILLNEHRAQRRFLLDALGLCPECARVGEHLLAAREAGWLPENYGILYGILEAELARSRFEAPALWERLSRYSSEKRRGLLLDTDRFRSWGLCELICRKSREVATGDAVQAVELAELAVVAAGRVMPNRPFEKEWLVELQALAWAHLGNGRRVLGELRSAEEAFSYADDLWEKGEVEVGDPLGYGVVILDLKASLLRDQRRFGEALKSLDQVVAAYRDGDPEMRDSHLAGRAFLKKAYTLDQMGEPERAVEALREAGPLLDPKQDSRLFLCVRHNLPVFQSRDVHREALAALAVFQQAVAREAAGAELVGRVAAFLDRARHDPGLRFDGERA